MSKTQVQDIVAGRQRVEAPEEDMTMSNFRRGLGAMLIAIVILALFNSAGFTTYARDLPGNAFSDRLVAVADRWDDIMIELGLTSVSEEVRRIFLDLKETQW